MSAPASLPFPELLEDYSQFFRLLSEPGRLQQGPMDVASPNKATGFSQSYCSRQLGKLQAA